MKDETKPNTAEEIIDKYLDIQLDPKSDTYENALLLKSMILKCVNEFSAQEQRRVAQQVRQECAARIKETIEVTDIPHKGNVTIVSPEKLIEIVDIEQFLK